jgi:hypothetical protein
MATKVFSNREKRSAKEILKSTLPNEFLIAELDKGSVSGKPETNP